MLGGGFRRNNDVRYSVSPFAPPSAAKGAKMPWGSATGHEQSAGENNNPGRRHDQPSRGKDNGEFLRTTSASCSGSSCPPAATPDWHLHRPRRPGPVAIDRGLRPGGGGGTMGGDFGGAGHARHVPRLPAAFRPGNRAGSGQGAEAGTGADPGAGSRASAHHGSGGPVDSGAVAQATRLHCPPKAGLRPDAGGVACATSAASARRFGGVAL